MKLNLNAENINYIKITYKDNNSFSHCIKASVKSINSIDIIACIKTEERLYIKTPQEIELGIAGDNGLFKANSVLKYTDWQEPYEFLGIKIPDDAEFFQNREYFRVKTEQSAEIILESDDNNLKKILCKTHDLSANGVCLVLDRLYDFPEDAKLKIRFPEREVITKAKYIRSDEDDGIVKVSYEFNELSSQDMDFISQVCLKIQLENKRKTLMQ